MKGILRCCCFSPSRTLEATDSFSSVDQYAASIKPVHQAPQTLRRPRNQRKSWWDLSCRRKSKVNKDWLLSQDDGIAREQSISRQDAVLQNKQLATARADAVELASPQIKAGTSEEKVPFTIQASSTASECVALPAKSADLGDGYERTPFCSDVRWRKDRSTRKLSVGGTASVYRGEVMHPVPEDGSPSGSTAAAVTHVAVKALNVEQGDNAHLAEHEGRVLDSLSSKEYVPDFHGYYTDPDTQRWHRRAYILTELVPGMNLDDMCYKVRKAAKRMQDEQQLQSLRRWMWGFTMHIILRIAQALDDLHQERSHRDIKAGNVMVSGWSGGQGLRMHLIDWANSRLHSEEHLLNEYCTPEYSAPQLIAAITSLPAPVMDDAACDMWSLGVVMFQLLASTVLGPQVPFEPSYEQVGHLVGGDRLRGIQACVQQQQADWAKHNPAYHAQVAGSTPDSAATQPWQLAAVQTAADFGDSSEDVARRYEQAAALLSGMLHPETAHRMTAQQLASDGWLQQAGGTVLGECPLTL